MEVEAIRGLVTITGIVTGTTGLLALSVGWRSLLALPVFALAFVTSPGAVLAFFKIFIMGITVTSLYIFLAVHLRHRLTVPEFGRPSRRSRAVTRATILLGAGTATMLLGSSWLVW